MAKASLRVQLSTATVKAGEPVRGEVVAHAEAAAHCHGVSVRKRWYAHGDGTTHHGPWSETKIAAGADWTAAGMEYRHPFTLPADAPPSFSTRHNQLKWFVQVSIGIQGEPPWVQDFPLLVQ